METAPFIIPSTSLCSLSWFASFCTHHFMIISLSSLSTYITPSSFYSRLKIHPVSQILSFVVFLVSFELPKVLTTNQPDYTNRLSFTKWYGSLLPGCRSAPFVWHAVQTRSAIITHWSARCSPVAVFYCWKPSFRCGWCSTMEQSATWYRCEWHAVAVPLWTQNIFI